MDVDEPLVNALNTLTDDELAQLDKFLAPQQLSGGKGKEKKRGGAQAIISKAKLIERLKAMIKGMVVSKKIVPLSQPPDRLSPPQPDRLSALENLPLLKIMSPLTIHEIYAINSSHQSLFDIFVNELVRHLLQFIKESKERAQLLVQITRCSIDISMFGLHFTIIGSDKENIKFQWINKYILETSDFNTIRSSPFKNMFENMLERLIKAANEGVELNYGNLLLLYKRYYKVSYVGKEKWFNIFRSHNILKNYIMLVEKRIKEPAFVNALEIYKAAQLFKDPDLPAELPPMPEEKPIVTSQYILEPTIKKILEQLGQYYGSMLVNFLLQLSVKQKTYSFIPEQGIIDVDGNFVAEFESEAPYIKNIEGFANNLIASQLFKDAKEKIRSQSFGSDNQQVYYFFEYVWETRMFCMKSESDDTGICEIIEDQASGQAGGKPHKNSYESMTVKDLKERAAKRKIKGYYKMCKQDLIEALRGKRK
jgi:hypothetical protein